MWPCFDYLHSQVSAVQTYALDNGTQRRRVTHTYLAVHTIIIMGQLIRGVLDILVVSKSLWQLWQVTGQASFNGLNLSALAVVYPWSESLLTSTSCLVQYHFPSPSSKPAITLKEWLWLILAQKPQCWHFPSFIPYFCLLIHPVYYICCNPPKLSISKCLEVVR